MSVNFWDCINWLRFGIGNLLEVMHDQEDESKDDNEDSTNEDNEDYDKKSDTAEDFSDINELAEDLQTAMQVWWNFFIFFFLFK